MDSPEQFVRRTLWGGLVIACAACGALAAGGLAGWAGGVAVGAGVALANFWLLSRAVLRISASAPIPPEGGLASAPRAPARGAKMLRAILHSAALRLLLAGAALGLALMFLPIHPLGVAAGLVGAHAGMMIMWMAMPARMTNDK